MNEGDKSAERRAEHKRQLELEVFKHEQKLKEAQLDRDHAREMAIIAYETAREKRLLAEAEAQKKRNSD